MNRRSFLKKTSLAILGIPIAVSGLKAGVKKPEVAEQPATKTDICNEALRQLGDGREFRYAKATDNPKHDLKCTRCGRAFRMDYKPLPGMQFICVCGAKYRWMQYIN